MKKLYPKNSDINIHDVITSSLSQNLMKEIDQKFIESLNVVIKQLQILTLKKRLQTKKVVKKDINSIISMLDI